MDTTAPTTPVDTELSDTELEELQHLALSEGCHNPQEAMRSRTARVVLERVSSQVFHATNGEWFSSMIVSIYDKFLSKIPITSIEYIMLRSVFQFSTNKQRAADIVSELNFAYGRKNQKFFDKYMKNDIGEVDPINLINYIIEQIDGEMKNVFDMPWIISLEPKGNGMFISTWEDWKKWLLEEIVLENEKWKFRKIEELMPEKEDTIELVGDFILTLNTNSKINWVHMYDESAKKNDHNWYVHIKTLLSTSRNIRSRGNWYFTDTAEGKVNVRKYDEEKEELIEIEWLQWIVNDEEEIEKLLQWEIAYLQYAGKGGLYTLDIKVGKLNKLATLELKEWSTYLETILIHLNGIIWIKYRDAQWFVKSKKDFWLHNWKLYYFPFLKRIKLVFRKTPDSFHIYDFWDMEPYLRKVEWPIRL